MLSSFRKKSKFKFPLTSVLLCTGIFLLNEFSVNNKINSEELIIKESNQISKYKDEYILGIGDVLLISSNFYDPFAPEFIDGTVYPVDINGNLYLKEIGYVNVKGETIYTLKKKLEEKLKKIMYEPQLEISIKQYKPVQVYLGGEVNRPGLYTLDNRKDVGGVKIIPPRVFDVLKEGQGITEYADLSKIRIIRVIPNHLGGGKKEASINFLSLIESGDQSQNIELHNEDYIFVQKSEQLITNQVLAINKSNLTPDQIPVFVNGNVDNPGQLVVEQGATLYEAILAAGGKKNFTGNIEHIRIREGEGTIKKIMTYNPNSPKNTKDNPLLMKGDIIIVRKNLFGQANEFLTEISTPFITGLGIYSLLD